MYQQIILIIIAKIPILFSLVTVSYLGLDNYGQLKIYMAHANLGIGLVFAGFLPAYLVASRKNHENYALGAFGFRIIGSIIATLIVIYLSSDENIFNIIICVYAFSIYIGSIIGEKLILHKRIKSAILFPAMHSIIQNVSLIAAYWITENIHSAILFSLIISILVMYIFHQLSNLPKYITSRDIPRLKECVSSIIHWFQWQAQFSIPSIVEVIYGSLLPISLSIVSTPKTVAIVSLSVAIGQLFALLPVRFWV